MKLPIVGLPFEAIECMVFAVIKCKCDSNNRAMTIRGIDQQVYCLKCNKVYAITRISYDAKLGIPSFEVDVTHVTTLGEKVGV